MLRVEVGNWKCTYLCHWNLKINLGIWRYKGFEEEKILVAFQDY